MENKKYEMESKKYFDMLDDLRCKLFLTYEGYTMEEYYSSLLRRQGEKSLADDLKNDLNKMQGQISILEDILKEQGINIEVIKIKATVSGYKKYLIRFKDFKEEDLQ